MRVLMGVHRLVAEAQGASVGDYVHFIDSLHVYDAERKAAVRQLELTSSSVCRRALD
jgi:thymidylate synthase